MAEDNGIPKLSDVSVVDVTVSRNLYAPEFKPNRYTVEIPTTKPLGETIIKVNATDDDTTVRPSLTIIPIPLLSQNLCYLQATFLSLIYVGGYYDKLCCDILQKEFEVLQTMVV